MQPRLHPLNDSALTWEGTETGQIYRGIMCEQDSQASGPNGELPDILGEYLERFASNNGRLTVKSRLQAMFRDTATTHPEQLTTRSLLTWITGAKANNTVRARLSTSRAFLRWCVQSGIIATSPADMLPNITKSYPSTYGKVQQGNPARFLTYDQAFGQLVAACQDGTDTGLRDEIIIRLGLAGMRVNEIATLRVEDVAQLPHIRWIGKGNRPRTAVAGDTLCAAIRTWLAARTEHTGQPQPEDALLLPEIGATAQRGRTRRIDWNATRMLDKSTLWHVVTGRAKKAGLGHVAPHDLRRSAASILHHTTTDDGAHRFDLLDIQRVLGHADPATTMRSYLEPMDSEVTARAAQRLD